MCLFIGIVLKENIYWKLVIKSNLAALQANICMLNAYQTTYALINMHSTWTNLHENLSHKHIIIHVLYSIIL